MVSFMINFTARQFESDSVQTMQELPSAEALYSGSIYMFDSHDAVPAFDIKDSVESKGV